MKKSIVKLFQENELKVSELYKIYSEKIPDHKEFWNQLSLEEVGHAYDIGIAYDDKNKEYFIENNFTRSVVKYVSDFVEEKIGEAQKNNITHLDAINTALRIEQSILEKKCFDMFRPVELTIGDMMKRLNRETERHVSMLRKELKKIK